MEWVLTVITRSCKCKQVSRAANMTTKLATATVGPEHWRNNTLRTIKLAQTVVHKSDKSNDVGRALDPVPHIRDIVASLSNEEVRRYTRDVRVVAAKLRESLLDTNEEIKSLTRGKEALEKALEHIRKDIKLNQDCQSIRTTRPNKEKVRPLVINENFNTLSF